MQESLHNFCRCYRLIYDEEPHSLSPQSWLIRDVDGKKWVIKEKSRGDDAVDLLKSFAMLHPCFCHPQPVSRDNEDYYLYPYIEGTMLSDGPFEHPEVIENVFELAGRLQALFRSLVLVPFYEETLRSKEFEGNFNREVSRFGMERLQRMDDHQKSSRQRDIARSYRWTEERLEYCIQRLETRPLWSPGLLHTFRDRIQKSLAIHTPFTGSNLSHSALQPEHLLVCPDGNFGIIGWHIEPRPRFYMVYIYLAWSFMHTRRRDAKHFYQAYLVENSSKAFYDEHHLVFGFCLLEQIVASLEKHSNSHLILSDEREHAAAELFANCAKNLRL